MIGHRIREARKQRGYNQQWLAEQIGVSQPSVSDWESGRNDPTMDNLAHSLSLVYQYNECTWRSWWVLCGAELNISINYISIALNVNDVWLLFFI